MKKANGLQVKDPIIQEKAPGDLLMNGKGESTDCVSSKDSSARIGGLIFGRTFVNVPFKSTKPQGIR